MTDHEAIMYAATWGSYMTGGDPGACMYGFSPEVGLKVQDERHRERCLEWIGHCKAKVEADPGSDVYDDDELDQLGELEKMITDAPLTKD